MLTAMSQRDMCEASSTETDQARHRQRVSTTAKKPAPASSRNTRARAIETQPPMLRSTSPDHSPDRSPRPAYFPSGAPGRRIAVALVDVVRQRGPVDGSCPEVMDQLGEALAQRLGAPPSARRTRDAFRLLERVGHARRLGHRRWRLDAGTESVAHRSGQSPSEPDLQAESVAQRDDLKRTVPGATSNSGSERGGRNSRACRRLVGPDPVSEDAWFGRASASHHGRWARWTAQALLMHAAAVDAARCCSPWALAGLLLRMERRPVVRGHRRQVARWLARLLDQGLLVHDSPGGPIGLPVIAFEPTSDRPPEPTERGPRPPSPPSTPPWQASALTAAECLLHPDERVQALGEAARARGAWRVDVDRRRLAPLLEALDREGELLRQHGADPLEHWNLRVSALPARFTSACGYLQAGVDESIDGFLPTLPEPGWSRVPPGHLPRAASEVA